MTADQVIQLIQLGIAGIFLVLFILGVVRSGKIVDRQLDQVIADRDYERKAREESDARMDRFADVVEALVNIEHKKP